MKTFFYYVAPPFFPLVAVIKLYKDTLYYDVMYSSGKKVITIHTYLVM